MDVFVIWFGLLGVQPPPPQEPPAPQTEAAPLTVGLGLESYYQYNWNRPFDRVNPLRAYDTRANSFSLQQASLIVERAPDVAAGRRFGGRLDLQFGLATETVQGNAANEPRPDVYRHVWQAYGSYVFDLGRGLQLDLGKFGSNLGYETNYAKDNNQFSRAFLFNFLPFYHQGVRLSLPVNDHLTVLYMLTNGTQQTEDLNDFKSHHVTAVVRPTEAVSWTTSYYAGREQPDRATDDGRVEAPDGLFRVIDSYVSVSLTPKLSVGADVNVVTNQVKRVDDALTLKGAAVYARLQASPKAAVALRYERLDDEGLFAGVSQVLQEVTATAEHKFGEGFLVRGEVRRDWSNRPFFTGARPGDVHRHQTTALVGLVWWFGNKSGAW